MAELAPGVTIAGRYRIERALGAGGMGSVHLATRLSDGERVVLKTLLASWAANPSSRKRFAVEAEAASRLSHPGIVRILEWDADAETPFLVMEHVSGRTLTEHIREPDLMAVGRAVDLLRQLLDALDTAHAQGIVHRDLKPANLMITESTGGERLKVLDFGLARILDDERQTRLTRTGQVLGTPGFLAPEQAKGDPVDARTDLWAVGVIAYVMLTKHLPFQGEDTSERILAMLTQAPVRLSHHRPDVNDAVAAVIHRSLEKEPDHRFPSAAALADALTRALAGETVTTATVPGRALAPPPTMPGTVAHTHALPSAVVPPTMQASAAAPPSAARPRRRGGVMPWLVATLLLVGLVGLGLGAFALLRPPAEEPVAVAQVPPSSLPPLATPTTAQAEAMLPSTAMTFGVGSGGGNGDGNGSANANADMNANANANANADANRSQPRDIHASGRFRARGRVTLMSDRDPPPPPTRDRRLRVGLISNPHGIPRGDANRWARAKQELLAPCFESYTGSTRNFGFDVLFDDEREEVHRVRAGAIPLPTRRCVEDALEDLPGPKGARFRMHITYD